MTFYQLLGPPCSTFHRVRLADPQMTSRHESSFSAEVGASLLAFLSVFTAVFLPKQPPLGSTRMPDEEATSMKGNAEPEKRDDSFQKRYLWEDPFAQANLHQVRKVDDECDHPPNPCSKPPNLLNCVIAVPSDMDREESDVRRGYRIATLNALIHLGYAPRDVNRLYELELGASGTKDHTGSAAKGGESGGSRGGVSLPYAVVEIFAPSAGAVAGDGENSSKYKEVRIAWLREEALRSEETNVDGETVNDWVQEAFRRLSWKETDISSESSSESLVAKKVYIGPESTVRALRRGAIRHDVEVISPIVTALSERELGKNLKTQSVVSTITEDRDLAEVLAAQLHARRAYRRILLILEMDSEYARQWKALLESPRFGLEIARVLYYPRRIDGTRTTSEAGNRAAAEGDPRSADQPPFGPASVDYLRRLESELHDARDVYDAVGVFGTDIHDKLQVLHALKPVLPEALFFTSDLHAYYDYPRYMSFLRNLLVVTPHPLVPRVPISSTASKSIIASPFRSCYDNSVFLAVWHAVEPIEEHELRDLTRGMVFKVGNNGAVRIDRLAENRGLRDVWTFLLAWLAMPIIVLGVNYYLRRRRERDLGSIDGRRALHWSMVAAAPLAMWVALLLLLLFSSEPVSWGDGISVWPTEILRVLAFSLALVFAYHVSALFGFDKGHSRGKKSGRGKPSGHPSVCAALREWGFKSLHLHEFFDRQAKKASGEGSPKGTESDAQRARVLSALWCALAVFVGGLTLALVLGMPRVPTGDSRVWYFDRILTCGALFSTIWLVFLLVEAAQSFTQTCAWVQSRKRPKDPKRSLEFFEGRVRVLQQIRLLGGCGLYGPFFVVGLLVMSRWRVFDDWTWPWSLRIGLGLIGAAIVIAHICLHRAAISARRYLEDAIASDMINDDGSDFSRSARLKMLERSAKGLDGGIFAGPFSHPVTRALIIPFTGVGTLNLLQWLQAP